MAGRLVSSGTLGFCFIFCFLFSYDGTFTRVFRPMQGSPQALTGSPACFGRCGNGTRGLTIVVVAMNVAKTESRRLRKMKERAERKRWKGME